MLYVSGERSLGNEIALSWTEALGPRPMIRNHGNMQNNASDLRLCRAAYRNRTDDLRITRGTIPRCARASCTDSTGNRTGSARGAGITRRPGPRTGPRPTPLRVGHLATVRHFTKGYPHPQAGPAVLGVTVYRLPARVYRTANCLSDSGGRGVRFWWWACCRRVGRVQ